VGLFLDGEVVGREPLSVRSGTHELEAEALLDAPGGKGCRPARAPARAAALQPAGAAASAR
jgi:hypothetical protein